MNQKKIALIIGLLLEVGLGYVGLVAYHLSYIKLFVICAFLNALKLSFMILKQDLMAWAYAYLAFCILVGWVLTRSIYEGFAYGLNLYYASAFIVLGILHWRGKK